MGHSSTPTLLRWLLHIDRIIAGNKQNHPLWGVHTAPSLDPMTPLHCPTCGRIFMLGQSPRMPFCSTQCAEVDLGRWLREEYGLPLEGGEDDFESALFEVQDNSP